MIDIDSSLIYQIINFLLVMVVLNYVLYRPIRSILKQRQETYAAFESDIVGLDGRVQERLDRIETSLNEARREAFGKKDEIKNQGMEVEKQIVSEASAAADARIEKIRAEITADIAAARDALKADIQAFSTELAQKVLGRSLQ